MITWKMTGLVGRQEIRIEKEKVNYENGKREGIGQRAGWNNSWTLGACDILNVGKFNFVYCI